MTSDLEEIGYTQVNLLKASTMKHKNDFHLLKDVGRAPNIGINQV
jgi:hypothetical protein